MSTRETCPSNTLDWALSGTWLSLVHSRLSHGCFSLTLRHHSSRGLNEHINNQKYWDNSQVIMQLRTQTHLWHFTEDENDCRVSSNGRICVSKCAWFNVRQDLFIWKWLDDLIHLGMSLKRAECDLLFQLPTKCGCWKTEWLKGSRLCCALTCHQSSSNCWGRYACWWMDKVILHRDRNMAGHTSRQAFIIDFSTVSATISTIHSTVWNKFRTFQSQQCDYWLPIYTWWIKVWVPKSKA